MTENSIPTDRAEILLAHPNALSTPGSGINHLGLNRLEVPAGELTVPVRFLLVARGKPDLHLSIKGDDWSTNLRFDLTEHQVPEHSQIMVDGETHLPAAFTQTFRWRLSGPSVPTTSLSLTLKVSPGLKPPTWLSGWHEDLRLKIRSLTTDLVRERNTRDPDQLTELVSEHLVRERGLHLDSSSLRTQISKLL